MSQMEAHLDEMMQSGTTMRTKADEFREKINLVYNTISELTSVYNSEEARLIAAEIQGYRQKLENCAQMLENYGVHTRNSAQLIQDTQDHTSSGVRGGLL